MTLNLCCITQHGFRVKLLALVKKCSLRTLFTKAEITCKDPMKIFDQWFVEARDVCDPRDMILTAILQDGSFFLQPLRCQTYSELGFTYYLMEKGISWKNDNAALTFIWPYKRMVRVEGITKHLPKHEIEQYFFNRIPYEQQINMFCSSQQSEVVQNKKVLSEIIDMTKRKYAKGTVPVPKYFCGRFLTPSSIEFYENAGGTFQNRLRFLKSFDKFDIQEGKEKLLYDGERGWKYQILSP